MSFGKKCDMFRGEWAYHPNRLPIYTNSTCPEVFDHQNCMKFGRPDSDFLKWRWKPVGCELPPFDSWSLPKGSLWPLLETPWPETNCSHCCASWPQQVQSGTSCRCFLRNQLKFQELGLQKLQLHTSSLLSPYLIQATEAKPTNGPTKSNATRLTNLYLDKANTNWTSQIEAFDHVIISAGRWFFGPKMYFENGHVVGCHFCMRHDTKNLSMFYGYRRAFKTAFKSLLRPESFKGVAILRTLSPAHFENGEWNNGGECKRTKPVSRFEMKMNWADKELYLSQIEVLRDMERERKKRGVKFRVLDITEAMAIRPDEHPNHFGHWPHENVSIADCVHWCLPGPIDTWNELLLQMLKQDQ